MLEQELNKYLEWCEKYGLNEKDYNNFYLYNIKQDMGFWFDEIVPLLEEESDELTDNLKNALLEN